MFNEMKAKLKNQKIRIVYPEGNDVRILEACSKLYADDVLVPIILGNVEEVTALATSNNIDLTGIEIVDMNNYDKYDQLLELLIEARAGKNTKEELEGWLTKSNYFGTMMVKANFADGLVGGATYSTGDTVRPSLQIIKMKPGIKSVSSAMIMIKDDERYVFGDCAINIAPSSDDLAATAIGCADIARVFDIDPTVALLSFSTKGSAAGAEVEKVVNAKNILDGLETNFKYDGEFQFDAAFVESVGKQKAPDSDVAGMANVFVFPSLEAGNIGYKIAQRLGGFEAVGPLLLGLNAPVNDLSRGCNVDEIYKVSIITAVQAMI